MEHLEYLVTVDLPKDTNIGFNTLEPLQPISVKSVGKDKTHFIFPYSCEVKTYWNKPKGVTEVSSNFPIEIDKEYDDSVRLKILLP